METSGFRADHHHHQSHVPQQSRRDKLRVQSQVLSSTPISHHLDSPINLDNQHQQHEFSFHQDQVNDNNEVNVRHNNSHHNNFLYDHNHQGMVSSTSEILDFSRNNATRHPSEVPHQSFMVNWNRNISAQSFGSWPLGTTSLFSSSHSLALCNNDMIEDDQVVTVASTSNNELALLPFSFASQDHPHHNHHHHHSLRTTSAVNDNNNNNINNYSNLQGLSLSLSSIYPQQASAATALPNMAAPRITDHHHHHGSSDSDQDLPKPAAKHGLVPKPSIISKACGKSLQDIVGVSPGGAYRANAGPLGPFTGYATILRNSRFLKPAQQLMEEFCGAKVAAIAMSQGSDPANSESVTLDHNHDHHHHRQVLMGNVNSNNNNSNTCASASMFYGSSEINGGGVGSNLSFESGSSSSRPEHVQQKKAKLLHMQEEVSRRYKQYRQQMQMVVSSFESVSGLSSATPYISLALKAVSRHFRGLKSTIADQLNHTRRALGEDLLSPTTGPKDTTRLKYNVEQGLEKPHRPGGPNLAFHEPQQHHIWRPQRGLPERSVAVLRAWLFEHFLHPYPTDTDKHMLATQTGLTRNQVSNWFINARVRVWKPMVEEIHTLETKGMSTGQPENNNHHRNDSSSNDHQAATSAKQLDCAGASNFSALGHNNRASMLLGSDQHDEHGQEKRSRLEFSTSSHEAPLSLAGSVVQGFVPYHRNGLEVWSRAEQ